MLGEPFPMNTHCPFSFGSIAEFPDMALIMYPTRSLLPNPLAPQSPPLWLKTLCKKHRCVRSSRAGIVDGTAAVATTDKEPGAVTALMLTLGSATS
jgi:hypothetical protein